MVAVLVRHRIDAARAVTTTLVVAITVTGAAGQFAARPSFDEVERLIATAEVLDRVCVDRGRVTTCMLPGYEQLGDAWSVPFEAAAAAAPAGAAPPGMV